jgi:hypothetical protein
MQALHYWDMTLLIGHNSPKDYATSYVDIDLLAYAIFDLSDM